MMNYPGLNELVEISGCRYMLVATVSQRARQLLADPEKLGDRNAVTMAVDEFFNDKLNIKYPEEYTRS